MKAKQSLPECPNCYVEPVPFCDAVGMHVVVCDLCGLQTGQHVSSAGAAEEWRDIVRQIQTEGGRP